MGSIARPSTMWVHGCASQPKTVLGGPVLLPVSVNKMIVNNDSV